MDVNRLVTQQDQLEVQEFAWGTLQWLASAALLPGAEQTLGISRIRPGLANPLHYHPNCEELLFVQQGSGRHRLEDAWIPLRPGTLVRIPRNVRHNLVNEGSDVMIC